METESVFAGHRHAAELQVMFRAIVEAGNILIAGKLPIHEFSYKADNSIVTAVDLTCARYLDLQIRTHFPDDAILNEETYQYGERGAPWNKSKRCWIIDPLDSTSSYVRDGKHYGTLIGLTLDGVPELGMTYKPELRELFFASSGEGAYRMLVEEDGQARPALPVHVSRENHLKLVVSRGRQSTHLLDLIHKLGNPPFSKLNGALKINEVARGEYTAFVTPPEHPMSLWDLCATQVILDEAGGRMTDLQGRPLNFRNEDPTNALGLIASNSVTHDLILECLAQSV